MLAGLALLLRVPFRQTVRVMSSLRDRSGSISIKPPNILVYGQDSTDWKARLERIVNTDLYLIYATTQTELESNVWIDNCLLLWLTGKQAPDLSDNVQKNIERFIKGGGPVVAVGHTDVAGVKILEGEEDADIHSCIEQFQVSCEKPVVPLAKTEGYLVTDKRVDSFFDGDKPEAEKYKLSETDEVCEEFTPVRVKWPAKSTFNVEEYFQFLRTRAIGRTMMYTENVSTTMTAVKTIDSIHGAVAVAGRQLRPVARGRNSWISPQGCAMFSVALHFNAATKIGGKLSFLQHIAALSIVRAIRNVHPLLEVGIKWPNDVYFRRDAKIAGILSTCYLSKTGFRCYLGCGVNVANSKPLTCVQELAGSKELTIERMIASMLTELEILLDMYEREAQRVVDEYHANWLHTGEEVMVEAVGKRAVIQSVDDHGFLLAKESNGEILRLQPDGNSFDLMRNLIFTK